MENEAAESQAPDLRATIATALEEASAEAEAPAETTEDTSESAGPKEAEAAPEAIETPPEEGETKDPSNETDAEGEAPEDAPAPIPAPVSWTADAKENFSKLPRELQEVVAGRERERETALNLKSREYAEVETRVKEFDQVLEPYRQQFELSGVQPVQAVQQLLAAQQFLNRDPVNAIKWLADQYRVDTAQLTQQAEAEVHPDPAVASLQAELNQTRQYLQNQQRNAATQAQAAQQQNIGAVQTAIATVRDEADAGGNPLRPHFARLEDYMAPIAERMARENPTMPHEDILKASYEQATWADPDLRGEVLAKQKDEAEKSARKTAIAEAKAAKKASASVSGAPGGKAADEETPKRSLREEIQAGLRRQSA